MADVLNTTQQIVLSVRMRGDEQGPQTGDVVLGGNIFGDFNEKESYDKNEAVIYNGAIYRSKDDVLPGEWDPDEWQCLTDITMRIGNFIPEHEYVKDEVILVDGHLYKAPVTFTTGPAFDSSEWVAIDSVNTILWDFEADSDYSQYEVVAKDGKLYRAKRQFISTDNFDLSDWELIGDIIIEDFQPSKNYTKGNIIVSAGKLYRAKGNFTSGATWQPEFWDPINSAGIGGFSSNTYYPVGSMIYVDKKLYVAKKDFTSQSAFNINDWDLTSETLAENYNNNTYYQKDKLVYYKGSLYRAKANFVSGSIFSTSDWELLSSSTTESFKPNTPYLEGTLIFENGILWIAKKNFTSGATFNASDWTPLTQTEQETYDSWMVTGTTVKVEDLDEKFVSDANAEIYSLTSVDSATSYLEVSNTLAKARLQANPDEAKVSLANSDSSTSITNEKMRMTKGATFFDIDVNNKNITMSQDMSNSLATNLATMSTSQKGVAKSDGATTRVSSSVLSAYPIPDMFSTGHLYKQYELCTYGGRVYSAKAEFTAGSWDITKWYPVSQTVRAYTSNSAYYPGDLVYVKSSNHYNFYMCLSNITSAPASMVSSSWYQFDLSGSKVYLDAYGHKVLTSTNLQAAYNEIDNQEYTNVRPLDGTTRYRLTTKVAGSTPPSPTSGVTTICLFTE